jgi:hypothetical protein
MEWSERRGVDGHRHEWGVRWDITNALLTNGGSVVTHEYRMYSDPSIGPSNMVERHRVLVALRPSTGGDHPWECEAAYLHLEALHPNDLGDPAWMVVLEADSHDDVLANLEAEARRLGWPE